MKIGLVCPEYPPGFGGGIGTSVQLLARGLVRAGHTVRVVGVYRARDVRHATENDEGVQVTRLAEPTGPLGWVRGRYALWRTVSGWTAAGELDVVEVPDYQGWAAGWRPLAIPVVMRLHGSASVLAAELGHQLGAQTKFLERRSLQRADMVVAVSRYTARRTAEVFGVPEARRIVYNAVEAGTNGAGQPRDPARVIFVGKLAAMKGVLSLMRAWRDVAPTRPAAVLHLFGGDGPGVSSGSMQADLAALIPPDLRASVIFHGRVPREVVLDELRQATCAVLPSYVESFANAPMEAMSAGCPTIFTARASGPELISDGVDGLLVDPDDAGALAGAIGRLLDDAALAGRIGQAGLRRIDDAFRVERMVAESLTVYAESMADLRRRRGM